MQAPPPNFATPLRSPLRDPRLGGLPPSPASYLSERPYSPELKQRLETESVRRATAIHNDSRQMTAFDRHFLASHGARQREQRRVQAHAALEAERKARAQGIRDAKKIKRALR